MLGLLLPRGAALPLSAVFALYLNSKQRCVGLLRQLCAGWRDCQELAASATGQTLQACRDAYAAPIDVRFLQVSTEYRVSILQGFHGVAAQSKHKH